MKMTINKILRSRQSILTTSRDTIDHSDTAILEALFERTRAVKKIGAYKKSQNLIIKDPTREQEIIERLVGTGETLGLDPELVKDVFTKIIEHSCRTQEKLNYH